MHGSTSRGGWPVPLLGLPWRASKMLTFQGRTYTQEQLGTVPLENPD